MKTKIIIAGVGGVGGYFGGLLAKHFEGDKHVEIYFVARGEHLKAIQSKGLTVIKGEKEFIAKPKLATDSPAEIGIADILIMATKSYDLEAMLDQLSPCIDKNTILLPLLNGVDSRERIQRRYPENFVLEGCVYIVARLKQAGVVENVGPMQTLYFGPDDPANNRIRAFEQLLKEAGIEAFLAPNISEVMWEKFMFISPTATATSYYNKSIGELMSDPETLEAVTTLMEEIKQVAHSKQIVVPDGITEKSLTKLRGMPFTATSSMHSDFQNRKPNTELEALTGYVIKEAQRYNLEVPSYIEMHKTLQAIT